MGYPSPPARFYAPLTTENFKFYYTSIFSSGVPVRVDPRPVGHAPPREEATMRTDADCYKEVYKLSVATL